MTDNFKFQFFMHVHVLVIVLCMHTMSCTCNVQYIVSGAYEPPKAARSVQLRIIAQNGVCIYSST